MSGPTYIYIVQDDMGDISAVFTVRYHLVEWLKKRRADKTDLSCWTVTRHRDSGLTREASQRLFMEDLLA